MSHPEQWLQQHSLPLALLSTASQHLVHSLSCYLPILSTALLFFNVQSTLQSPKMFLSAPLSLQEDSLAQ